MEGSFQPSHHSSLVRNHGDQELFFSSCTPQYFPGEIPLRIRRSISYPGVENKGGVEEEEEEGLSDDGLQLGEKKKRLNLEQVKALEKSFDLGNKLETERKQQLAKSLGLQPRQIAVWFQNRRARWKTKQLEKDYKVLKKQFEVLKVENDLLLSQNTKLHAQLETLKSKDSREAGQSAKFKKERDGYWSNVSENSSYMNINTSITPLMAAPNPYHGRMLFSDGEDQQNFWPLPEHHRFH